MADDVSIEVADQEPPDLSVGWAIHDVAIGGAAGLVLGFVAGLFGLQVIDSVVVPFVLAGVGAIGGALLLVNRGRGRNGITFLRASGWLVFGLGAAFLWLLFQAIANFT